MSKRRTVAGGLGCFVLAALATALAGCGTASTAPSPTTSTTTTPTTVPSTTTTTVDAVDQTVIQDWKKDVTGFFEVVDQYPVKPLSPEITDGYIPPDLYTTRRYLLGFQVKGWVGLPIYAVWPVHVVSLTATTATVTGCIWDNAVEVEATHQPAPAPFGGAGFTEDAASLVKNANTGRWQIKGETTEPGNAKEGLCKGFVPPSA